MVGLWLKLVGRAEERIAIGRCPEDEPT